MEFQQGVSSILTSCFFALSSSTIFFGHLPFQPPPPSSAPSNTRNFPFFAPGGATNVNAYMCTQAYTCTYSHKPESVFLRKNTFSPGAFVACQSPLLDIFCSVLDTETHFFLPH